MVIKRFANFYPKGIRQLYIALENVIMQYTWACEVVRISYRPSEPVTRVRIPTGPLFFLEGKSITDAKNGVLLIFNVFSPAWFLGH